MCVRSVCVWGGGVCGDFLKHLQVLGGVLIIPTSAVDNSKQYLLGHE